MQIGQMFGLAIVMIFQGSLNTSKLEQWGWRVPFLLAIVTGSMVRQWESIASKTSVRQWESIASKTSVRQWEDIASKTKKFIHQDDDRSMPINHIMNSLSLSIHPFTHIPPTYRYYPYSSIPFGLTMFPLMLIRACSFACLCRSLLSCLPSRKGFPAARKLMLMLPAAGIWNLVSA